jgi:hypothetical protein
VSAGPASWRSEHGVCAANGGDGAHAAPRTAGGFPALGGGGRGVGADAPLGVLSPYCPASWFHARGIFKVTSKLLPRLPDVSRCLFLTFTIDPSLFADPESAFESARDKLRRVFFRLRRGVEWEGKTHRIDAPYCIKLEFHRSGWVHFHAIFLTRRFLPGPLLNELWGLGRTNVRRISNSDFHYLLKYVVKGGELPAWALARNRLRVFQPSRGFMRPADKRPPARKSSRRRRRRVTTLGQRLQEWERAATFRSGRHVTRLDLIEPFRVLFDAHVFTAAKERRYLGSGRIQIDDTIQLLLWITNPSQLT